MSVKRLIRDEKGQTLILVLILLFVGGLIIAAVLDYMGTGLVSGQVYDRKAAELYAADAGAEDAVWRIQNSVVGDEVYNLYCGQGNHTLSYPKPGDPPFEVNGKNVAVTIMYVDSKTYRVESIATGNGSGTKIDAYITGKSRFGDFSGLLNRIILTPGEIDIKNGVDLYYPEGCEPQANYTGDWPTAEDLAPYYWQDVKSQTPYAYDTIDLNGSNMTLDPLYRNGTLTIKNSSTTPATLKLTGTVYVTDNTFIGTTDHGFTLDLNGKTIFVASNTTASQNHYAIEIGSRCTSIKGPGVIVAVGDVYFGPNSDAGSSEGPIFVLSAQGETFIRPGINIYGAIAGKVEVMVQQGNNPTITYPQGGFGSSDLNFPTGVLYLVYSIASWEVIPL
jgi:hypothetical protein